MSDAFKYGSAVIGLVFVTGLLGCGISGSFSGASDAAVAAKYTIQGRVVTSPGVNSEAKARVQPDIAASISGENVYLYAAGTSGYGSAATLLAMTTTSTAGGGTFNFTQDPTHINSSSAISSTYSCPSYTFASADGSTSISKDSYIYIVGVGGDTQDGSGSANSNTGAVLMVALGDCQQLAAAEPFVDMSEVTTVASVFALAPYMSPVYPTAVVNGTSMTLVGGALGTSTSYVTAFGTAVNGGYIVGGANQSVAGIPMGYQGLVNAFGTVPLLVNTTTGTAVASFTTQNASLGTSGVAVTGTPEQAKINHIADALAYCIDSSNSGASLSTQCTTLFALTVPPISSSTTSLGSGVTFPAATDTLQASYYMASNPTDNTTAGTATTPTTSNVAKIFNLASGNADFQPTLPAQPTDWTISIAYSSTSTCGTDTTQGAFLGANPWSVATDLAGNVALINGNAVGTAGGSTLVELSPSGVPVLCQLGGLVQGRAVLFDETGSLWVQGGTTSLYQTTGVGATPVAWPTTDGTTSFSAGAITADAKGNIFYFAGTQGNLERFAGAQGMATPFNSQLAGTSLGTAANVYGMAADKSGNIYYPNNSQRNQIGVAVLTTGGTYVNGILNNSNFYYPYGAAVEAGGTLITGGSCCSTTASYHINAPSRITTAFNYTTGAITTDNNTFPASSNLGGIENTRWEALDGAGNIWMASLDASTMSGGNGLWQATEFNSALAPLSPNGTVAFSASCSNSPTSTGCNLGGGYVKASMGAARSVVIDISGNVWYPADQSANAGTAGATNGNLVEIVGAGVPVVGPLTIALRDNKVAAKP